MRWIAAIAVGAIIGAAVGMGGHSVWQQRRLYDRAIQDASSLVGTVKTSQEVLKKATAHITSATHAIASEQPTVAYSDLEKLRALENPFRSTHFSRKLYYALAPETVDLLFRYFIDVQKAFDQFQAVARATLPDSKKAELDDALAQAAGGGLPDVGCVPGGSQEPTCELVFLGSRSGNKVEVRLRKTSKQNRSKALAESWEALSEGPADHVLVVDPRRSRGVLGTATTALDRYKTELTQAALTLTQATDQEERLIKELNIAADLKTLSNTGG